MMKGRKMKFKKTLLAAGLLAAAASANAAIDTDSAGAAGTGDGGGELFVSVFRNVPGQQQSYLIDTGITSSQLLSGSVANGTVVGNVGSFFTTAATSSFVFNAGAVANLGETGKFGSIFTSNNASAVQTTANNYDLAAAGAVNVNMETFTESGNASLTNPTDYANNDDLSGLTASSGGYHGRFDWGSNLGGAVPFSTEGSLDTGLALWGIVVNEDFETFTRVALGFLTADSASGNIIYNTSLTTPEVPLPAAVWLLGSALIGMTAVGRRRRNDAVVAA